MAEPPAFTVRGKVVRGHRVASGTAASSPYPSGTIALQTDFFAERGLDLRGCFAGTINVDVRPHELVLFNPAHLFRAVDWTSVHGPEDFSFAHAEVRFAGNAYQGWVYHPHTATKPMHFQPPSVVEIIAPRILGLDYGAMVELALNPDEIRLRPSS